MSMAIALTRAKEPLERIERVLPAPGSDEVLLRIEACALGQLDWNVLTLDSPPRLPLVPGVEGVGVVEAVGEGVTLAVGTRVLVTPLSSSCGTCASCASGNARWCPQARWLGLHADGLLATHAVVRAQHLVVIDADRDAATTAVLGGSGWTAAGALANVDAARDAAPSGTLAAAHVDAARDAAPGGNGTVAAAHADAARDVAPGRSGTRAAAHVAGGSGTLAATHADAARDAASRVAPGGSGTWTAAQLDAALAGSSRTPAMGARDTANALAGAARVAQVDPATPTARTVGVFGVGGVGHLVLRLAKRRGLDVRFSEVDPQRAAWAVAEGAAQLTRSDVLDAAIVCTPSTQAIQAAARAVRPGGTVVLAGISPTGRFDLPVGDVVLRGVRVIGSVLGTRADLDVALRDVAPVVETAPLHDAIPRTWALRDGGFVGRLVFLPEQVDAPARGG